MCTSTLTPLCARPAGLCQPIHAFRKCCLHAVVCLHSSSSAAAACMPQLLLQLSAFTGHISWPLAPSHTHCARACHLLHMPCCRSKHWQRKQQSMAGVITSLYAVSVHFKHICHV